MYLNDLARIMKVSGETNRLKILCEIFGHKKICVTDIAKNLHLSVAVVSHHLRVLSDEGLLYPDQEGKCSYYKLRRDPVIRDLKHFICKNR